MFKYEIKDVSKAYDLGDGNKTYALKDICLTIENPQLVMIHGPSGCGKTTLINLLSLIDKPSSGTILFNNQRIDKWNEKRISQYRNKSIGIVFQHYQLLEDETGLFNIMLPLLISGVKEKEAKKIALEKLKKISIDETIFDQKVSKLSGGEKQRIAILRAIINNPQIVFADEPTGALDSTNSKLVMDLFKKISEDHLVIMISHNEEIIKEYGDRVITLKDGCLISDEIRCPKFIKAINHHSYKGRHKGFWKSKISSDNYHRRYKRNLITILSLGLCICFSLLVAGFLFGKDSSIKQEARKQYDIANATIVKEVKTPVDGSGISLVKTIRPSYADMDKVIGVMPDIIYEVNADALIDSSLTISYMDKRLDDLNYSPIYSFLGNYTNKELLLNGYLPYRDNLEEVVINEMAFNKIKENNPGFALNSFIQVRCEYQNTTHLDDGSGTKINDLFVYENKVKVVGIIKEFSFLENPKIYYSYVALLDYLQESMAINHSTYLGRDISWYEEIQNVSNGDSLSSYSYRLFIKDISNYEKVNYQYSKLPSYLSVTSAAYLIEGAINDIFSAMTIGMEVFLVICILGTLLLSGVLSFSAYLEDRKRSAILSSIGASNNDIASIYLNESLTNSFCGTILSFVFSIGLQILLNKIIFRLTGYQNMILIPFLKFKDIPFVFPLIVLIVTILVSILSTLLPIAFSKKISIKEELKSND